MLEITGGSWNVGGGSSKIGDCSRNRWMTRDDSRGYENVPG
jgi:hypothetical protein